MRRSLALFVALVLAGCVESPPAVVGPDADNLMPAPCTSRSSTNETKAGGYSYRVQGGGGGGGTFYDLEFQGDPAHLEFLNITMEWSAQSALTQDLRIDAWLYETLTIEEQPDIQGPSPLVWSLRIRDLELMEGPGLALGPAERPGLPASASATVIDQPVTLTIEEVYCPDTFHP